MDPLECFVVRCPHQHRAALTLLLPVRACTLLLLLRWHRRLKYMPIDIDFKSYLVDGEVHLAKVDI